LRPEGYGQHNPPFDRTSGPHQARNTGTVAISLLDIALQGRNRPKLCPLRIVVEPSIST
jgi:hypothetical protein